MSLTDDTVVNPFDTAAGIEQDAVMLPYYTTAASNLTFPSSLLPDGWQSLSVGQHWPCRLIPLHRVGGQVSGFESRFEGTRILSPNVVAHTQDKDTLAQRLACPLSPSFALRVSNVTSATYGMLCEP